MSSIELSPLSPLKKSSDLQNQETRKKKAIRIAFEEFGKPPLAILEGVNKNDDLTDEGFIEVNLNEVNIKEKLEKANIHNKILQLDSKRKKLAQLLNAQSHLKLVYGPTSEVGKLKKQIKKDQDDLERLVTDAILDEFGEGKRKKHKKKHPKKDTKKHKKKHPKKHTKKQ